MKTSMRFLLLGSLFILCQASAGCKAKVDVRVKGDWFFVNNSTHKIEVISKSFNSFSILAEESYLYETDGLGSDKAEPTDYLSPYGTGNKIIIDDTIEHILQRGESITDVQNYVAEKIEDNYYKFTYTFTDENVAEIIGEE